MINIPKRIYTMVDLFAGCGGLSLGFENSGFSPIFVNELNKDALNSYLINRHHELDGVQFKDLKILHSQNADSLNEAYIKKMINHFKNIQDINFNIDKINKDTSIDVLTGGPPCQGYSGIGHRRSYSVHKQSIPSNHLFNRMSFIISLLRPRIFLFENVRGLLNSYWVKGGKDKIWPDVFKSFDQIKGYNVKWDLIFSKDYGVPQNRPRVLLVGIRNDIISKSTIVDKNSIDISALKCGFLPQPNGINPPDLDDLLGDLEDETILEKLNSSSYPNGNFETTKYPKKALTKTQRKFRKFY